MGTPTSGPRGRLRITILSCATLALLVLCFSLVRLAKSASELNGTTMTLVHMLLHSSILPNNTDNIDTELAVAEGKTAQRYTCNEISLPHHSSESAPISQFCKEGPFRRSAPSKERRLAVVIRGESFRGSGGMYDRSMDVNRKSFECQEKASKSHVSYLIEAFESCGFVVHVFLGAWLAHDRGWSGNSSQQLIDFYGKRVVTARFRDHRRYEAPSLDPVPGVPQAQNYNRSLILVADYSLAAQVTYDAIVILRFDLIIKKHFLLAPYDTRPWEKVMFAFAEWLRDGRGDLVADTIHWFPWKFANCGYLEGFREHFSGAIFERIGKKHLDFLDTGHHDANSMADWNPLYKQCRPEQVYDFVGGYAIVAFGIEELDEQMFALCGRAVRQSMERQGIPPTVPNVITSFHGYVVSVKRRLRLDKLMMEHWPTHAPHAKVYDVVNKSWIGANSSGWFSALRAMARGFYQALKHPNTKASEDKYKGYQFDRVIFVRIDYAVSLKKLDAYECDTSKYICIGFGAPTYITVPVFIIASHNVAQQFSQRSLPKDNLEASRVDQSKTIEVLGNALNVSVQVSCTRC